MNTPPQHHAQQASAPAAQQEAQGVANSRMCEPPMVQLVDHLGQRVVTDDNAAYWDRASALTADDFRALYRHMELTRRFDVEATAMQRQGELALFVPTAGQEAAAVGSGYALKSQDYVFPAYREQGMMQVRGIDPIDRMRFFRGEDHGGWDPSAHNVNLYSVVIGAHTLHAVGYAMGVQRDGRVASADAETDTAVVAYFGDGASAQGDVNESLVFASVNNAPVVFFCQNNQWAISEPNDRQFRGDLYRRGAGFDIPGIRVDGNDVLACYAVTQQALDRARSGGGPTFIEAYTYRMTAHTTADDQTRYRGREEEEFWAKRDPLSRLRALMSAEGCWDDDWFAQLTQESQVLGERLRKETRQLGSPGAMAMFSHVYASPHATVDEEREWFTTYQTQMGEQS